MRCLLLLLCLLFSAPVLAAPAIELVLDGPIGPATSAYVSDGLAQAEADGAPLVILRLDTPGGLSKAMREIVQAVLASPVPVVGYVAPTGARAASAGTYILYASHIAAMAPATNLGAATPIRMGGGSSAPPDSGNAGDKRKKDQAAATDNATAKRRKVVNDAVAYIRGLANQRGRNADWAEKAVREGTSLSAQAALDKDVIDLRAPGTGALLAAIDGRTVTTSAGETSLATDRIRVETQEPDWRMQLLAVITNPTVAYILMMIGLYGLILEGMNPGALVPGVIGGICLLAALFAFQVLPISFAGLGLLLLGIALMVAEAFAPSFGILGLGGVAGFVLGSIMLMDTDVPGYQLPMVLIAAIAAAAALLMGLIIALFVHSRRSRVVSGGEGMVGASAEAMADFDERGRVFVHGEDWYAITRSPVRKGQQLRVEAVDGLTLTVVPVGTRPCHPTQQETAS